MGYDIKKESEGSLVSQKIAIYMAPKHKTIKGQKKSLDRLWRYRPSSKAIHETRTEERRHE